MKSDEEGTNRNEKGKQTQENKEDHKTSNPGIPAGRTLLHAGEKGRGESKRRLRIYDGQRKDSVKFFESAFQENHNEKGNPGNKKTVWEGKSMLHSAIQRREKKYPPAGKHRGNQ